MDFASKSMKISFLLKSFLNVPFLYKMLNQRRSFEKRMYIFSIKIFRRVAPYNTNMGTTLVVLIYLHYFQNQTFDTYKTSELSLHRAKAEDEDLHRNFNASEVGWAQQVNS